MDGAIEQFKDCQHEQVNNFIAYLNKHRHRIVNYSDFQAEGISIGSGIIKSDCQTNWGAYQALRHTDIITSKSWEFMIQGWE